MARKQWSRTGRLAKMGKTEEKDLKDLVAEEKKEMTAIENGNR